MHENYDGEVPVEPEFLLKFAVCTLAGLSVWTWFLYKVISTMSPKTLLCIAVFVLGVIVCTLVEYGIDLFNALFRRKGK